MEEKQEEKKPDGAKLVAGAIIGMDYRIAVVNDKSYVIMPPTIAKIAGAAYWLCDFGGGSTLRELLLSMARTESLAKALSWFIQGDDALADELARGGMAEVVDALEAAFSMIDAGNFMKLSALLKSARLLMAKPR